MDHKRWSASLFDWFEAVLTHWKPGASVRPHNHGGACGFVFLIKGDLYETKYIAEFGKLVRVKKSHAIGPSFSFLTDKDVHDLVSPSGAIAFHIYFPKPKDVISY